MPIPTRLILASAITAAAAFPAAAQNVAVTFGTNWVAQAEHGGYYQAVADGTYAACGLDVTILPGGPQVNNRALMLAGQVDFSMGGSTLDGFSAVAEGLPIITVAASFQKDPQVIVTWPGVAKTFADLAKLDKVLISDGGVLTFWAWMIQAYGFKPEQREVYTFSAAPLIANKTWGMQGYLSSEPYFFEKETGTKPDAWLIADAGYTAYSTTIETLTDTVANRPEVVQCFVDGSAIGWTNYLYGDNSAANEMIKKDNPEMTDEAIAYGIAAMKEHGIVFSGDALTMGAGAMTDARVEDFYNKMVSVGAVQEGLDWKASYTLQFVNKGVGLDRKPAE
ncbi:ABC transporter substrate-binding protein [Tabrizicola sp.]|jgi:NitT/TauT family transport system substrate-binding protein|uniref:ABC transporter substrate-binding protein n=1 Tax=Tabrizicola sp. TaxID=2005166 RepID=UPI0025E21BD6|nr:ABC transporter substrate-binding protein [Tabrizicola sp.]MBY0351260.1 ABC transporter substrate-binding protein [Tabrizicola sp.]